MVVGHRPGKLSRLHAAHRAERKTAVMKARPPTINGQNSATATQTERFEWGRGTLTPRESSRASSGVRAPRLHRTPGSLWPSRHHGGFALLITITLLAFVVILLL